ncbi:uncharacterized protein J3R85_013871 [Psidium guajava]|nr:uncharacterized protein J3R85_013871 [Psidium guajava]
MPKVCFSSWPEIVGASSWIACIYLMCLLIYMKFLGA